MQATPDAADQVTALLEAGEYEDAIRLLEGISQSDDRTLATFHLGRAYEAVAFEQLTPEEAAEQFHQDMEELLN